MNTPAYLQCKPYTQGSDKITEEETERNVSPRGSEGLLPYSNKEATPIKSQWCDCIMTKPVDMQMWVPEASQGCIPLWRVKAYQWLMSEGKSSFSRKKSLDSLFNPMWSALNTHTYPHDAYYMWYNKEEVVSLTRSRRHRKSWRGERKG